jgi:cyclase
MRAEEWQMYRSLIIARITPGSEDEIAQIFSESDRTDLPRVAGVQRRELYSLGDCYAHLLETNRPGQLALDDARQQAEFERVSRRLSEFVSPYRTTWRSPRDAVATRFYEWTPAENGARS